VNKGESTIEVRAATEADLNDIAEMMDHHAIGHPAQDHPRPISRMREAFFGPEPVAHLLVATRGGRIVGTMQWTRMFDMYWAIFGGFVEWLYVRPDSRGLGIPAALVAEICRQIRAAGGEFLHGGAEVEATASLYERVATGWNSRTHYISGEAFQAVADLAGATPREIVRQLPDPELNRKPPLPRKIEPS
jgi:GNAT superfamily N-acetyltransferase